MGYLTSRKALEEVEQLWELLPEGWTLDTPCHLTSDELSKLGLMEDFVGGKNKILNNMVLSNTSFIGALEAEPADLAQVKKQQYVACMAWVEWFVYDTTTSTNEYLVHLMWARLNDRDPVSHAILVIDMVSEDIDLNNSIIKKIKEAEREARCVGGNYHPAQGGGQSGNGLTRNIVSASKGKWYSRDEKRWCTTVNKGWKPRKGLAAKRKGQTKDLVKRCRAVWF